MELDAPVINLVADDREAEVKSQRADGKIETEPESRAGVDELAFDVTLAGNRLGPRIEGVSPGIDVSHVEKQRAANIPARRIRFYCGTKAADASYAASPCADKLND